MPSPYVWRFCDTLRARRRLPQTPYNSGHVAGSATASILYLVRRIPRLAVVRGDGLAGPLLRVARAAHELMFVTSSRPPAASGTMWSNATPATHQHGHEIQSTTSLLSSSVRIASTSFRPSG